jgi:uncharacterized protein (UPF0332 family)
VKPENTAYIQYRMGRAHEALALARLAIDHGFLPDAVNRLYYACFYAVSGLLLAEGVSAPTHKGVQTQFGRQWIVSGRLPPEMGRFFHRVFEQRLEGDYAELVNFEKSQVEARYEQAQKFVIEIGRTIDGLLIRSGAGNLPE